VATQILDGVVVDLSPEEEATLPRAAPKLDPTDNTFQDEVPWPSLTA
jgi:hypothetical protein